MNRIALLSCLLLGCALEEEDVELGETESASTNSQGTEYQGTEYQGTEYQGTEYQGTEYQGTEYQGAYYGSSSISGNVNVSKSTIELWRQLSVSTWEQRGPTYRCTHNSSSGSSCTYYSLSQSPLTGARFRANFMRPDGTIQTGYVQIGSSTTASNALITDTSTAMHPLDGAATTTLVAYNGTTCTHPLGCRKNTDLYLYDVKLIDANGVQHPFCPAGQRAYAFAGAWDATGQYLGGNKFTFACTNGTIAKCARWGYRPFGRARWTDNTLHYLAPYHQACVRAATADYCGNGHSFTQNGTMIDIYDYSSAPGAITHGFIPNTAFQFTQYRPTAFQWEATFDHYGATRLDFTRYVDANVDSACDQRFALPVAGTEWGQPRIVRERDNSIPRTTPTVGVGNVNVCSHSEKTIGRFLHPLCSECTQHLANMTGAGYEAMCMRAGTTWSQTCVNAANTYCSAGVANPETTSYDPPNPEQMAVHSECSTGSALEKWDSACTIKVCSVDSTCCDSWWGSSCTSLANSHCSGGREGYDIFGNYRGFCNVTTGGGVSN